jgi:ribosome-associated heat shock protein Hsp15
VESSPVAQLRIDRWLVAARIVKTRTIAQEACAGGKVDVNGARASAHRMVRPGDRVEISTARGRRSLIVLTLAERRQSPAEAKLLFEDKTPPPSPEPVAPPGMPDATRERGSGRPSKRDRRRIDRLRGW